MEKINTKIIRIAFIGPESTGKSSLTEMLAEYYHTIFVPEFARKHLESGSKVETVEDITFISNQQATNVDRYLKQANKLLFIDTESIYCKVWADFVFGNCPKEIKKNILAQKYDLYLLTSPDIPWKKDLLRVSPDSRKVLYETYRKELDTLGANYEIVLGEGELRFLSCLAAVNKALVQGSSVE